MSFNHEGNFDDLGPSSGFGHNNDSSFYSEPVERRFREVSARVGLSVPSSESNGVSHEDGFPNTYINTKESPTLMPVFDRLSDTQKEKTLKAQSALNQCIHYGFVEINKTREILDFGAGSGEPTLTLARIAEMNGGSVEVVEPGSEPARRIVDSGILEPEQVYQGDGVELLKREELRDQYDLITCFMLGPDVRGELIEGVMAGACNALQESGKLLVTSDPSTMAVTRGVCGRTKGAGYDYIHGKNFEDRVEVPDVMVVSFGA